MKVVISCDTVVKVPEGVEPNDVAMWINPGLLYDEYVVKEVVEISAEEAKAAARREEGID